jgi:hypothetical protein
MASASQNSGAKAPVPSLTRTLIKILEKEKIGTL